MPQVLFQVAIGVAVSMAVGAVTRALTKTRRNVETGGSSSSSVEPSNVRSSTANLATTVDVGAPLTGIFGHRRVGGKVIINAKSGTKTYIAVAIAGAPVTAINAVYFNDQLVTLDGSDRVTTGPWYKNGFYSARVKLYTGAQTAADPWLDAAFPGWTTNHVGYLQTYAVIEFDPEVDAATFDNVYSGGIPDVTFDVSGFKCYDPRNGAHVLGNPATWSYSANPAILKANYLIHELGAKLPTSDIDWTSVATAAAICDQAVALKNGLTEPRYQCSALWNCDERHEAVLARMDATDAGGTHLIGQQWRVYSGAWAAPTAAITPDGYAGDGLTFSDVPALAGLCNGVRGKFCSPLHNYEDRDFPPWRDAAALAADGREAWLDLDLSFVTSHTQAQRLAKIAYNRARFGAAATVETKFDFFDTVADDTITLTDDLAGFSATSFRVTAEEVTPDWTIRFSLVREDASFWTWTPATDEKDFTISSQLLGGGGTLQAPGGYIVRTENGANWNLTLYGWGSPSPAASGYETLISGAWIAFPGSRVLATNTASGIGTPAYYLRSVNSVTGEVSAPMLIRAASTIGSGANTEATTPDYGLPPPAEPLVFNTTGGSAAVYVPQVPGARAAQIEIWIGSTSSVGASTLAAIYTNVSGGISHTFTGTPGQARFIWARTKNPTDGKWSEYSNPALVVL